MATIKVIGNSGISTASRYALQLRVSLCPGLVSQCVEQPAWALGGRSFWFYTSTLQMHTVN